MYKFCKTEESLERQRGLEYALQRMMQHSRLEDISVSDLCKAVGIPRTNFYRYFDSKEDALHALIDHTVMDVNGGAIQNWEGNQRVTLADLEYFFHAWKEKRELLDALANNGRSWLLVDRIMEMKDQEKTENASGISFARKQAYDIMMCSAVQILLRWHKYGFPATSREMASATFDLLSQFDFSMPSSFL